MKVLRAVAPIFVLGALIGVSNAAPAEAQAAPSTETGCNTFDAGGDTRDLDTTNPRSEPRADITQLCVDYGYSLRVAVVLAQPTIPASDPGWGESGDSRLEVGVDTDDDPELEFLLAADGADSTLVYNEATGQPACAAPFYVTPSGYAVELSRNCLGVDTVAVSALMVYDPAPAPTTGPLVADLAPDAGFVPRVTRSAPAVPQPLSGTAAPVCMADEASDTVDENFAPVDFDAGDIVQTCLQHSASEVRLTVTMRRPTDPQSESVWRARSAVAWDLDVNNDLEEDFQVSLTDTGARVYASDAEEASDYCEGTAGFDATALVVHLPRPCLGNPAYLAARPIAIFARIPQLEPEPPLSFDLYRYPGFTPLVGAPGATVPAQATTPPGGTPAPPSAPATPGIPGGVGNTVTTTVGGSTSTTTRSSGGASGAAVTRTAATPSAGLASTGVSLDPALLATGLLAIGICLVALSRRRVALQAAGQWDVLPAPRRGIRSRSRG